MKTILTKEFAKEVLSIPSVSGREERVRDFLLTRYAALNPEVDEKGNVYVTKDDPSDPSGTFPCVSAHIDTVHHLNEPYVYRNGRLPIREDVRKGKGACFSCPGVGIGADDKAGVAIACAVFDSMPKCKAVFFVGEETNMAGSSRLDPKFFGDVEMFVQFDSPGCDSSRSLQGQDLFDDDFRKEFLDPVTAELFPKIRYVAHPWTDTWQVMQKTRITCVNAPCGYYDYHTVKEYVSYDEMLASAECFREVLTRCHKAGRKFERPEEEEKRQVFPSYANPWTTNLIQYRRMPEAWTPSMEADAVKAHRDRSCQRGGWNYKGPGWRS